ncbi:T9SS type A sorting domain-containing protein [Winogradskyella sp.]|uniref:T9SS type A sorting domain-containing protein n=1 Tax=Winogradskyella sp. TaxID=1883156 RepID=UPI003BABE669
MKNFSYVFTLVMLNLSFAYAQDITLSFGNVAITNDGIDDFYEADIFIESSTDFYVGSGQLYLDYNTAAFGDNISANNNIEYSQPAGSILGFSFGLFSPAYKDFVQNDNTSSRVSLSFQQNIALVGLETAPVIQITSTPKALLHIKMRYVDANLAPGICFFSDGVFQDQFFTACGGGSTADCTNNPGTQITNDTYDCSGATLSTAYTYNNAWSPSDPNGVSTASDNINIVAGNATITSNTDCDNINISAGAGLTVNSGVTLTTASGMVLESTSISYSSVILDGTLTGTTTYRRHVNQTASSGGNDLISPPVSGETFDNLLASNSNIVSNAGNTLYLFGPFDKASASYMTYANTETVALTAGVGYRAATTDNSTLSFSGDINQSNVNIPVVDSGPSFSAWNLIGNPYPSYLNVQDFLNNATNATLLDETNVGIYGYDGDASDGWVIYNLNTTDVNTVIAPGQGFFIAAEANGSIAFTPSMRRHGTGDDFVAGRNNTTNQHLRLKLSNTNDISTTDFYFNGNSTDGLDAGYDAAVFGNTADDFAIFSHLLEANQGVDMAIQSLPLDLLSSGTMIPLGVNANQGEQLTIGIESSNLPTDIDVYLMDTQTNQSTHLNTEDFVITPVEDLSGTGRFYIGLNQQTLGNNEIDFNSLQIYTLKDVNQLVIRGTINHGTKAKLYDINGRVVLSKEIEAERNYNTLDTASLQAGMYIIELSHSAGTYTQKVIID